MLILNGGDQRFGLAFGKQPAALFGDGHGGGAGAGGNHDMIVPARSVLAGHGGAQRKGVAIKHEGLGIAVQEATDGQGHMVERRAVQIHEIGVTVGDGGGAITLGEGELIVIARGPGTVIGIQVDRGSVVDGIDVNCGAGGRTVVGAIVDDHID